MNRHDDEYTLIKDYHGDIKRIRKNSSKRVNIDNNVPIVKKSHICLTKPKDIAKRNNDISEDTHIPKKNSHSNSVSRGFSIFLILIFTLQFFSVLGFTGIYFIFVSTVLVISTAYRLINTHIDDFTIGLLLRSLLKIGIAIFLFIMGISLL